MKATSKAVKDSRERAGVSPTSFAFTVEEKAEIDALAKELDVPRKVAVLEAIRAFRKQGQLSNKALLKELEKRLK